MNKTYGHATNLSKLLVGLIVVFASACTTNEAVIEDAEEIFIPEVQATPAEPVMTTPAAPVIAEPKPSIEKPSPPEPTVVIVLSDESPAYANVAAELVTRLKNSRVYTLPATSADVLAIFAEINKDAPTAVIAIGLSSALAAKHHSETPVVFCQVFNFAANNLISDRVKGVSSIPPLSAQLNVWKHLDPELRSIGLILGDEQDAIVQEAVDATTAAGITLVHETAQSDQETLYHFKRLATDIDGYWLFPDNRILSPTVIRQIFTHAAQKNVRIAVFSPALLRLGAAVSFSASDSDIALTVLSVLDRIANSETASIPAITPLSGVDVTINDTLANSSYNDMRYSPDTRVSEQRD